MDKFYHQPVMVAEVLEFLNIKSKGIYVDGTLGGGGHSEELLHKSKILNLKSRVIGIDQDDNAIQAAKKRLKRYSQNVIFAHANFRNLSQILDNLKIKKIDGILLDLGVSSHQLDNPSRGFSFRPQHCHPELDSGSEKIPDQSLPRARHGVRNDILLDMRMDKRQKFSAYEIINNYSEEELRRIFFEYGEERFSRPIAREIVKRRQEKLIRTASDLVEIIKASTPPKYRFSRQHHFATKIFQALRIEVNDELGALREVLPQVIERLKKGGRLVVISFHSLEDRIVKHFFREQKAMGKVEILTKKPLTSSKKETALNPRASSGKMRVVEKI